MQFFTVAQIIVAEQAPVAAYDWPTLLLDFFEGLFQEEREDILKKPHLSLQGEDATVVVRYEPTHGGLFILGHGGKPDDQDLTSLKPLRARGFKPMEALSGVQRLARCHTKVLQLDMSPTARLCLIAGGRGLIVGHTGLPSTLLNLDSTVANFAKAADLLVTA
jgi:hypothetical protein